MNSFWKIEIACDFQLAFEAENFQTFKKVFCGNFIEGN